MDYLPPYKTLFQNAREMSRAYRKQTNSLLLRMLGSLLIVIGILVACAVIDTLLLKSSGSDARTSSILVAVVIISVAVLLAMYYSARGYARAQEIGLAAVQNREPDFTSVSVWQHLLFFLILGLPVVVISVILNALHLQEFSGLFTLTEVSIFYLAPVAVIANGSAVEGVSTSIRLFRANPSYVSLCGAAAALVTYSLTYFPILITKALGEAPLAKIMGALLIVTELIILFIVLFRYEPFYRAQIYQNMVAAEEVDPVPQTN